MRNIVGKVLNIFLSLLTRTNSTNVVYIHGLRRRLHHNGMWKFRSLGQTIMNLFRKIKLMP